MIVAVYATVFRIHIFLSFLCGDFLLSSFIHLQSYYSRDYLWVDGFPIVSVLAAVIAWGQGFANSYLSSSAHASILILPHLLRPSLPCFTTWCLLLISLQLVLCASWTVFLLLCPGLHSASTSVAGSRHPWFSSQEIVSMVGNAEIEPQNCRTAVWHSIHWATTFFYWTTTSSTIELPHPPIELPHHQPLSYHILPLGYHILNHWVTTSSHWATTSSTIELPQPQPLSYHILNHWASISSHWATTSSYWATTSFHWATTSSTIELPHPPIEQPHPPIELPHPPIELPH